MNTDFWANVDLYGNDVVLTFAKEKFTHWTFREKSIPSWGSPCYNINTLSLSDTVINKVIQHKNNTVTLITSLGFIRLIKI